jgi:DNA modification methylase
MTPYYSDPWLTVYGGDCRDVLASMPDESVHCVVTSPPYWGLRDYGDAGQLGLEPTPEEYVANMVGVFREVRRVLRRDGTCWLNLGSSYLSHDPGGPRPGEHLNPGGRQAAKGSGRNRAGTFFAGASGRSPSPQRGRAPAYGSDGTAPQGSPGLGSAYSGLCDGCRDAQTSRTTDTPRPLPDDASPLSLTARDTERSGFAEASPDASPLGVPASTPPRSSPLPPGECSHCGNCGACLSVLRSTSRDARACVRRTDDTTDTDRQSETSTDRTAGTEPSGLAWGDYTSTLKPKDLVPIPWMVAMALQADGWYLRSEIIWSKLNPMPESVSDRPTKSHEYLFLLTKAPRYYFDADAVREPESPNTASFVKMKERFQGERHEKIAADALARKADDVNDRRTTAGFYGPQKSTGFRNLRSVWNIATQPYPGAHFATFPEKLVEPCIKAGTSEKGVCPECGAPWVRVVERSGVANDANEVIGDYDVPGLAKGSSADRVRRLSGATYQRVVSPTDRWRPSCAHDAAPVPATICDPFGGSGTTARVANRLSRRAILVDLNGEYLVQQLERNRDIPLGLGAA